MQHSTRRVPLRCPNVNIRSPIALPTSSLSLSTHSTISTTTTTSQRRPPTTTSIRSIQNRIQNTKTHQEGPSQHSDPLFPDHQQSQPFSFSRHNVRMPENPRQSPLSSLGSSDIPYLSQIPLDKSGRPIRLLSDELREQNFQIEQPSEPFLIRPKKSPPPDKDLEPQMPLFLDATQPFLTAVTPIGSLSSHLKVLSIFMACGAALMGWGLYDIWLNERTYLTSYEKLQEYVKLNNLLDVFSSSDSRDELGRVYRSVVNSSAANEAEFRDMQNLLNKHLAIGVVLLEALQQTETALNTHRDKLHQEIAEKDPNSPVISYYQQIQSEEKRQGWLSQQLRRLHDLTGKLIFLALADGVESLEPSKTPVVVKTVVEILGLDKDNQDNQNNQISPPNSPRQQQPSSPLTQLPNNSPETTSNSEPILTPELLTLYSRLQEVEHYLLMIRVANTSLNEDTRDLFEQYICPTFALIQTKQPSDLIQSIATSYAYINSAKMILQLLNTWLLYQQTKEVFPSMVSFEDFIKLWSEQSPYNSGVVGRLVQEEQEHHIKLMMEYQKEQERLERRQKAIEEAKRKRKVEHEERLARQDQRKLDYEQKLRQTGYQWKPEDVEQREHEIFLKREKRLLQIKAREDELMRRTALGEVIDEEEFNQLHPLEPIDDDDDDLILDRISSLLAEDDEFEEFDELDGDDDGEEDDSDHLSKQLQKLYPNLDQYEDGLGGHGTEDLAELTGNGELNQNHVKALFDQMIRVPGTLLAQEPPRYKIPPYIQPHHAVNYITEIFNTPSFIPKEHAPDTEGDDNTDNQDIVDEDGKPTMKQFKKQLNDEDKQRDEIIEKFAAAPTLKAVLLSSTLTPLELTQLFSPPNPDDIIDLSVFPSEKILLKPRKTAMSFGQEDKVFTDSQNGDHNDQEDINDDLLSSSPNTKKALATAFLTDQLSNLASNNVDDDGFSKAVIAGFIQELSEKGLPLNQEMIQMTFFSISPFLNTNFYLQINPLPRVDTKSSQAQRISTIYSLQQQYLSKIAATQQRDELKRLKMERHRSNMVKREERRGTLSSQNQQQGQQDQRHQSNQGLESHTTPSDHASKHPLDSQQQTNERFLEQQQKIQELNLTDEEIAMINQQRTRSVLPFKMERSSQHDPINYKPSPTELQYNHVNIQSDKEGDINDELKKNHFILNQPYTNYDTVESSMSYMTQSLGQYDDEEEVVIQPAIQQDHPLTEETKRRKKKNRKKKKKKEIIVEENVSNE